MPRGITQVAPATHVYRHLLREASYLPPTCQPFIRSHIRSRFRKHQYDAPLPDPATKTRLRRARHDFRYLWAANHGLLVNLTHILLLAFGRLGKRRRTLIAQFVKKGEPTNTAELERQIQAEKDAREKLKAAMAAAAQNRDKKAAEKLHEKQALQIYREQQHDPRRPHDWLDEWDLPKFHALAASQSKQSFWSPRSPIKGYNLNPIETLPRANTWGRPLAAKVVRSKLRKWYKWQVHRLMPPLGEDEWERLRLLATGQMDRSAWEMPRRRPAAVPILQDEQEGKQWDWQRYATEPVRSIERGSSRKAKARTGEQGEAPYGLGPAIGIHTYTRARFWQRLYTRVWEMTPKMKEREDQPGKWDVVWGRMTHEAPVATAAQMAFFEGAVVAKARKGRSRFSKVYAHIANKEPAKAAARAGGQAEKVVGNTGKE